ncbi:glutathione peroxidase [Cohnella thailandensis]|uniref:Glutathione peroxidase n=1 Tax=Cohnella thailandensis TaxID=557557 RepID=A0A841SQH5_9BACL|nr:glutathione peroxidase [Cohnella thailandensis]MBB6633119.1 glutathione peroxidase [Cohnella thailandensis]MBP1975186.1 glutathione peroxidase [Cohnella thailandensis]
MSVYSFQAAAIDGKQVELSSYRGKILLIVNTASECAYARQFADLQMLYERWKEKGFEILGFPCNQFNGREPGSHAEIKQACESRGVTFPLFEKVEVRGPSAHPLYRYLTAQAPFRGFDLRTENGEWMDRFLREKHPEIAEGDGIKWNFTKFLIGRDGEVRERFETPVEPADIEPAIQSLV